MAANVTTEEMRRRIAGLEQGGFHQEARDWMRCVEICERLERVAEALDALKRAQASAACVAGLYFLSENER